MYFSLFQQKRPIAFDLRIILLKIHVLCMYEYVYVCAYTCTYRYFRCWLKEQKNNRGYRQFILYHYAALFRNKKKNFQSVMSHHNFQCSRENNFGGAETAFFFVGNHVAWALESNVFGFQPALCSCLQTQRFQGNTFQSLSISNINNSLFLGQEILYKKFYIKHQVLEEYLIGQYLTHSRCSVYVCFSVIRALTFEACDYSLKNL